LVEMSLLGVLQPDEVVPRDWSRLTESLSTLSGEAGWLGGIAIGLCHDVQRSIGILVSSVEGFAREGNPELGSIAQIQYVKRYHASDLQPWEAAVRTGVRELSALLWDAARHNPRMELTRQLNFADDLTSEFARLAVRGLADRSKQFEQERSRRKS
jgi:hypothetical protein